ncbi:MAG: hypothetical protein WAL59_11880 [Roseiarcus sp.]
MNGGVVALAAEPEMAISEAAEQVSHRIGVPGTRAAPLAHGTEVRLTTILA